MDEKNASDNEKKGGVASNLKRERFVDSLGGSECDAR